MLPDALDLQAPLHIRESPSPLIMQMDAYYLSE